MDPLRSESVFTRMNLILRRFEASKAGIFSEIMDEKFNHIAVGLEHAYPHTENDTFHPKLPPGVYDCIRGEHRLHEDDPFFSTFEVMGVEGHSGILFHTGNYNNDSDGCILVGDGIGMKLDGGKMIVNSRLAFNRLLELQKECDSFKLTVEDL